MNKLVENIIAINSDKYYDLQTFADITNRSAQSIRLLIGKGNRFRKIDYLKLGRALYIEEHELVDFPFACAGRSKLVLRYTKDGDEYSEFVQ
jgi:hypothetical protein